MARARALSQPYGDGYWGVLFQGAKKEVRLTATLLTSGLEEALTTRITLSRWCLLEKSVVCTVTIGVTLLLTRH